MSTTFRRFKNKMTPEGDLLLDDPNGEWMLYSDHISALASTQTEVKELPDSEGWWWQWKNYWSMWVITQVLEYIDEPGTGLMVWEGRSMKWEHLHKGRWVKDTPIPPPPEEKPL